MPVFIRAIVVMLLVVCASNASAADVAANIQGYNGITVKFSSGARTCGLLETAPYAKHLKDGLAKLDVFEDPAAVLHAELDITETNFGNQGEDCVVGVELSFSLTLQRDQVDILETVEHHDAIVDIIESVEDIVIILYEDTEVGVSTRLMAARAPLQYIDALVLRFASQR